MKLQTSQPKRSGFTLLELLVVVAILAIIASGLLVAYEGLDTKAASGVSTYNLHGIDQTLRNYVAVNRTHPDGWDSLMFSSSGTGADAVSLAILNASLSGLITPYTLTTDSGPRLAAGMQRLEGGAPSLWYVNGTANYNASLGTYTNGTTLPAMPNRVFDIPLTVSGATAGGWGIAVPIASGLVVPRLNPATVAGLNILTNVQKLGQYDLIVMLGLGDNCSAIKPEHGGVGLSEAPFDGGVLRTQYGRFIALFHLGTDEDHDGTWSASELENAHLVGVLDARGNYFDAAYSQATGQSGN